MPHVSRHAPDGKVAEKIYKELFTRITESGTARERASLSAELFTPTERIMLAKRLAIICMLGEGSTFEDIQETLCVSPSTVGRVWEAMQRGRYKKIVAMVRKKDLLEIIQSYLPPSRYAPRWASFD